MAKDPAFLFYSADFITGTQFMSDEQVGKYIRLLCAQHMQGHLSKKHMMHICKTYDEDIFEKFKIDEEELYYNEVLEGHIQKRKDYAESRRQNRLNSNKDVSNSSKVTDNKKVKTKKDMNNISLSYDDHMVNENVIVNKELNREKSKIKKVEKLKNEIEIFRASADQFADDYGADMINAFVNYWTEYNEDNFEMKWQVEKRKKGTFAVKNRLVTWHANNKGGFVKTGKIGPKQTDNDSTSKLESAEARHNELLNFYPDEEQTE